MFLSGNAPASQLPLASPEALDETWRQTRLTCRGDLQVQSRVHLSQTVYLVSDPARNKFFQIGEAEKKIFDACDGRSTIDEIIARLFPENIETGTRQTIQVARWLVQNQLASPVDADNATRLQDRFRHSHSGWKCNPANLFSFRVPLVNPTRFLDWTYPRLQFCFHPIAVIIWGLSVAAGAGMIASNWSEFATGCARVLDSSRWLWLFLIWVVLKIIHEMGHGIACRRYGGNVPEAGVLFLLFTPLAYVNVTSSWGLASRWQRIVVSSAGMVAELFVAACAAIAWVWLDSPSLLKDLCLNTITLAGISTVVFNANPLMRFDGYYIFSDLLDVPNLSAKSSSWLWDRVRMLILGWSTAHPGLIGRERWIAPIYGLLAMVWRALVTVGLLIAASVLFHGTGVILALAAIFSWYLAPNWKRLRDFRTNQSSQPINLQRLGLSIALACVVFLGLFLLIGSPANKSAPAITRFQDETILRAASDGFVQAIHTHDGERVEAGQCLVELQNEQLAVEFQALESQVAECTTQAKIHLQADELAKYQAEIQKLVSLNRQLQEKQKQLEELKVRAPFSGIVLQRDLEFRLGSFLKQGDAVLTIAKNAELEIIVSIAQDDFAQLASDDSQRLRAVFAGTPVLNCNIKNRNPAASTKPPHLALCASHGGPLPVRQAQKTPSNTKESSTIELLTPRFSVELLVDSPTRGPLYSGQRGKVIFPVKQHSLGAYWYLSIHNWLEQKFEDATKSSEASTR